MAYTTVPTVVTAQTWTASNQNQYLKDNMAATAPGQVTTKGDIVAATGTQAVVKLAVGDNGESLIAASGETTGLKYSQRAKLIVFHVGHVPLETGENLSAEIVWHGPDLTLQEWDAKTRTAPTGADILADVHLNGTTIWSTQADRAKIVASATSGNGTDFNTTTVTDGDVLTLDVDQIGSTLPGDALTVTLYAKVTGS